MDNIGFGLWMTGTGMSIVFGMLALLMGLLALMGRLDRTKVTAISSAHDGTPAVAEEPSPCHSLSEGEPVNLAEAGSSSSANGMTESGPTPELLAAITTAVVTHVRVRRNQAAPEMREAQPGSRLFASRWVAVGRAYQNKPWK